MQTQTVLLVDPHEIVRQGLRGFLRGLPSVGVIRDAADGTTALRLAAAIGPDVVIADLAAPSVGVSLIGNLHRIGPDIRVIAFTANAEIGMVRSALDAGVSGYALKNSEDTVLRDALAMTTLHRIYLDPRLAGVEQSGLRSTPLSERERQVAALVALGHSNKDIAARFNLSVKTIETYRYRALEKLGFRNRTDLVRYAINRGWFATAASQAQAGSLAAEMTQSAQSSEAS